MEEKVVNISHKLILDNRKEASVTGVKDVISFDEKEILLQTADGKPVSYTHLRQAVKVTSFG